MTDPGETPTYFAQIADGLEPAGAEELTRLGAVQVHPVRRGIHFAADLATLYRINYCTRLCSRVLAPIHTFPCPDATAIYRAGRSVDWSSYFNLDQTFAVFASTAGSAVPHSQFAGLKLKDAIADQFRDEFGQRPHVDPRHPDLWVNLHVEKERGTISIDTSGGSLHRRGYREDSVDAPLQETVAAAMVHLSGWDGQMPLADPMCGSGTLAIEAAMAYCRIPAAFLRAAFGFQRLPGFSPQLWKTVKDQVDGDIRPLPEGLIHASDNDPRAVAVTRTNSRGIPDGRRIGVSRADFRQIANLENHVILCNPPYGIRLQTHVCLRDLYRQLGDFLKQRCQGSQAFIYFGNRELIKAIGLKPAWKRPLNNGGLEGRLVKFVLY